MLYLGFGSGLALCKHRAQQLLGVGVLLRCVRLGMQEFPISAGEVPKGTYRHKTNLCKHSFIKQILTEHLL